MNRTALGPQVSFHKFESHITIQQVFTTVFQNFLHINVYLNVKLRQSIFFENRITSNFTIYVNIKLLCLQDFEPYGNRVKKKLTQNVKKLTMIF